jgi:tripartite-type tricarboxylate transporter receptor subunit TctC
MKFISPSTLVTALLVLAFGTSAAVAQTAPWPQKTVRFIVPTPPGSPADVIVRLLQPRLQEAWGQSVVIENKSGAGGNIATQEVLRAADSHTIFAGPDTVLTINPHLYKKLPFRYESDVIAVTYLARFSQMLVCNPAAGVGNVAALLKASRSQQLSYASSGAGTPSHMAMEMFIDATGAKLNHIPYRGPAPAAQDVVGGQVHCGFLATTVVLPFVKQGLLVALGVSGDKRSPQAPNVPTIAEEVAPGFNATFHESLQMPKATPRAVVDKIQSDVARALAAPDIRARLIDLDLDPMGTTHADATRQVLVDFDRWKRVAQKINLVLD